MKLTKTEQQAVNELQALGKRWPKTLTLFARAGHLVILKPGGGRTYKTAEVERIQEIACDGGDPQEWDIA